MKKQYFINANIIDPHNSINENGGLIVDEYGKIEATGKRVNKNSQEVIEDIMNDLSDKLDDKSKTLIESLK